MSGETTTSPVDVGALAGSVVIEAQYRLAEAVTSFLSAQSERGQPLDEVAMSHLLVGLLGTFDGFERKVAGLLVDELEPAGVPIWGLPTEFADLAAGDA